MPTWITNNRLYDLARQGRRLTPWWGVFALASAMLLVSSLFGLPVQLAQMALAGFSESEMAAQPPLLAGLFMGLLLAVSFGTLIVLVWLWVWRYEKRPFATLGFERRGALFQYGRGLLIGVLAFGGSVGLMALFGYVAPEAGDPARAGLAALGGVLLIFLPGWFIQGAAEEVLTRGWMLPVISARYRPWLGILLSSLFFAVMHGLNPNVSILALVNLMLYGLFAALYALREESLWGICAFHSVWNWAQGNLFGLAVSGQETGVGTLFDLMETGPDWFTGGAFGPEGGLAVTIVLVLGSALMVVWPKSSQTSQDASVEVFLR
ncbi:type II CAAX endopeptidase family protein [uncultured Chloroflexus sp.]|uniref:CPBP family intramembrane glutamic endopeptidase n=1 Tax=uncultured Chloroflexus sp. TaxID=214040 RepID=UPI00261FE109|nr:type II CAAX endopeptidase family protein [uncultured Chloroflexus sp.]